jgi:ABC-type hemin transport system substrate-binding protein
MRSERVRSFLAAAALASLAACGEGAGGPDSPAGSGVRAVPEVRRSRIVSLSPAITHSVERLGCGDAVVGCTPWCGRQGTPAVGSLEDRDLEAIAALRPTLLLRQSTADDAPLAAVASASGAQVRGWRLSSVADVRAFLPELGGLLEADGLQGAAGRAADAIAAHEAALRERVLTAEPVLFLFATDPPAAFGQGTYVDELWTAMGGRNAVAAPGYPQLSPEDVAAARPRAVVVVGPAPIPEWLARLTARVVPLDAPCLLEPGAAMLLDGPSALRSADARIAGEETP